MTSQYYSWQGRYGYSFFMGVLMPIAPTPIVKLFPAAMIALMVLTFYKVFKRFVNNPLLASAGFTVAFLASLPNIWQTFYWYGSSTNYVFPFIIIAAVLLWLWR